MQNLARTLTEKGLVLATNNSHKLIEFQRLIQSVPIQSLNDVHLHIEVEETGNTFAENAKIKAQAVFSAIQRPALSDDSGLVVDYLGGQPGVQSARYGGPGLTDQDRLQLLLKNMEGAIPPERTARFVCVLCLYFDLNQEPLFFTGTVEGTIAEKATGNNGFGYDPAFIETGRSESFGVLPSSVKDENSHRARAIKNLLETLSL